MCFRCLKDKLFVPFSSVESAYGSRGEVKEPGLWLKREQFCDGVIVDIQLTSLSCLLLHRPMWLSERGLDGRCDARSGEVR